MIVEREVDMKSTYTIEWVFKGFKWLGNRSLQLREEGVDVLFAYEEALGYCAGSMRR